MRGQLEFLREDDAVARDGEANTWRRDIDMTKLDPVAVNRGVNRKRTIPRQYGSQYGVAVWR